MDITYRLVRSTRRERAFVRILLGIPPDIRLEAGDNGKHSQTPLSRGYFSIVHRQFRLLLGSGRQRGEFRVPTGAIELTWSINSNRSRGTVNVKYLETALPSDETANYARKNLRTSESPENASIPAATSGSALTLL